MVLGIVKPLLVLLYGGGKRRWRKMCDTTCSIWWKKNCLTSHDNVPHLLSRSKPVSFSMKYDGSIIPLFQNTCISVDAFVFREQHVDFHHLKFDNSVCWNVLPTQQMYDNVTSLSLPWSQSHRHARAPTAVTDYRYNDATRLDRTANNLLAKSCERPKQNETLKNWRWA